MSQLRTIIGEKFDLLSCCVRRAKSLTGILSIEEWLRGGLMRWVGGGQLGGRKAVRIGIKVEGLGNEFGDRTCRVSRGGRRLGKEFAGGKRERKPGEDPADADNYRW